MITVLFFAELQEVTGGRQFGLKTNSNTIMELKEELIDKFEIPQLEQAMVAINEEYALVEDTISSGDVIAFIPPVSGG